MPHWCARAHTYIREFSRGNSKLKAPRHLSGAFKPSPKTADSIKAASFASLDLFPNGHIGVDQKRVRKSVFFKGVKCPLHGDIRIRFGIIGGVCMFSAQSEFDSLRTARSRIHDDTRERIRTFFFIGIDVKHTVHLHRFADIVFRLDHHIEHFSIHHRRAQTRQIDDARILLFGKQRVFSLSRQSFCTA